MLLCTAREKYIENLNIYINMNWWKNNVTLVNKVQLSAW